MQYKIHSYRGRGARLQFRLLMGLYRFAVNRWLYGIYGRALARCFSENNAVLADLGNNRLYWVYLNDAYWTRFLLFHRSYEPEVRKVIEVAAGHTGLFCDLGANKGLWSVYGAHLFDKLIAVEASEGTYRFLQENTEKLRNVTRHKAAIFEESGRELSFVNTYQSHASARLSTSGESGAQDQVERVTTIKVDDLVPAGTAALIKLDVEGAEIPAMSGAARALSDGSALIYEDHGADRASEPSAYLLKQPNISVYSIENGVQQLLSVEDVNALKTDRFKGYNFLAGRNDSPLLAGILEDFAKTRGQG